MDDRSDLSGRSIPVLRITSMASAEHARAGKRVLPESIMFELCVGGELVGCWTATPQDMGLQPHELFKKVADRFPRTTHAIERCFQTFDWIGDRRVDAVRHSLPFTSLPLRIRRGLSSALSENRPEEGAEDVELWLEFADSTGLMPLVGWERILRTVTAQPVLRLPYSRVPLIVNNSRLEIAFCCTAPATDSRPSVKELRELAEKIVSSARAAAHCELHVFADRFYYEELKKQIPDNLPIHVYDPLKAAVSFDAPGAHPWRRWMVDELKGRAIDVFHTVAPARFSGQDEAFLIVARLPAISEISRDSPVPVRFVSAYEHAQFCAQFGAWATVFTSFGSADERTATAAVADGVARCRPGVVALHDSAADLFLSGVADLYRFLSEGAKKAPRNDALSVYCNPKRLAAKETTTDPFWAGILTAEVPEQLETTEEVPEWLAAAHRILESSAMLYLEPSASDSKDQASREGARDALRFVSATLAKLGKTREDIL